MRFINGSQGYESYDYDFGDLNSEAGARDSSIMTMHTFVNPSMHLDTVYTVTLTVQAGPCSHQTSDTIRVLAQPIAAFSPESSTYQFPAPPIMITNLIHPDESSHLSYLWRWNFKNDAYVNNFSNVPHPGSVTFSQWGEYEITQLVTAPNRICSHSVTLPINIIPPGVFPNFEDVLIACSPNELRFNNTSRNATYYQWDFDDGFFSSERHPWHTFMTPGTYNVRLTAYGENMESRTIEKEITVLPTPQAGFGLRSNHLYVGQRLDIDNFSVNTAGQDREPFDVWYRWDWGDGSPISTEKEPSHIYMSADTYTVTLTVGTYTVPQCSTQFRSEIDVEPAANIILPNVFRPDPTGEPSDVIPDRGYRNFLFFPSIMSGTNSYQMVIFNRLGIKIYETHEPTRGWNGYYKGNPCEEGVYVYRIEGVYDNGKPFFIMGDILLVR